MRAGAELAAARRARGLSVEELSRKTKIKIFRLRALEGMEWEQLPTLVYLKGFLHTYATEVGLDPDEVTGRYLDALNVVAPEYAEREAHPPPVPEGQFVARESIWDRDPDLDDFYAMDVMYPEPPFAPQPELPLRVAPPSARTRSNRFVPAALVGVVALIAGWVIGSYLQPILPPFTIAAVMPQPAESAKQTNDERLQRARERVAAAAAELAAAAPPVPATLFGPVPVPLPQAVAPALGPPTVRAGAVGTTRDASRLDLSGWWALTNRVDSETADVSSLNLGFHLQLQQQGNRVSGTGERWMENGRSVPASSRTQIEVNGTLIGRRLELNFTEHGRQPGAGKLVMNVTDADTLRGRFVSAAANARATSLARRMNDPR